jgi:Peptidase A4 family
MKFYKIRKRIFLLLSLWLVLLLLTLTLLSFLSISLGNNPESRTIRSLSWSGFIINKEFNQKQPIESITGQWTVPRVNASATNGYSSAWIGIGGQSDKTLIQVGTEQDASNQLEAYYAWYEILPDFSVTISNFEINPGDTVFASISLTNSTSKVWSIKLNDLTNGNAFSKNIAYNSTQSSGEWIIERPNVRNQTTTLTNFGTITFNNCYINLNNATGPIGNFTYSKIAMTNQLATPLTTVSGLNSEGSSFNVTYIKGQ